MNIIYKKRFGLRPSHAFVAGKLYSTDPEVAKKLAATGMHVLSHRLPESYGQYYEQGMLPDIDALWARLWVDFQKDKGPIIIVDDGGDLIARIPTDIIKSGVPIVAVEQTTNGIDKLKKMPKLPCPVINVARSGAKFLESPAIALTVIDQLKHLKLLHEHSLRCGVIGRGIIGDSVVQALYAMGHAVYVHEYDLEKHIVNGVKYVASLVDLFDKCDIILGCTPDDPFIGVDVNALLSSLKHPITLISCSSGDSQFGTILRYIQQQNNTKVPDIMADITLAGNPYIKILQGGFPINFTRRADCDPPQWFDFTRALLQAGIVNAYELMLKEQYEPAFIQLSPAEQIMIIKKWFSLNPKAKQIYENFDIKKIVARSEGKFVPFACDENSNDNHIVVLSQRR